MSTTETKKENQTNQVEEITQPMRRKSKALTVLFIITLSITACGRQESLNSTDPTEQQEQTEIIEETTETKADPTEQSDSTEQESLTSEATNSEGLTVEEASQADYEYMEEEIYKYYEGDIDTQIAAVKKDYGIDSICGAWFIYYYGSAAGDQRSYAINQRTGEKIVAGPYSYFYGSSLDDDGVTPFWGTDKTYPGDEFPEFEENMTLAIQGLPAHTNGQ